MRKKFPIKTFLLLLTLFISFCMFSCSSTKKTKYFQDIPDSGQLKTILRAEYAEPKIQTDDILTVIVQTIDPLATANVNAGNITTPASGVLQGALSLNQLTSSGFLVNKDGNIEIPVLGIVKVVGLTTSEARDVIYQVATKYYKSPTVTVRFSNFKINVTGEVLRPGVYVMPNEKVSVLDALALAGDLTIYAKRENILLIRENLDGTKTPYRINLKKTEFLSSPFYYLKQNDIIYVEPGRGKAAATDAAQAKYFALGGSLLSVLIVLFTRK